MKCECVLDRLCSLCTNLDMVRVKHAELKHELKEVEEELIRLEDERLSLFKELVEHP